MGGIVHQDGVPGDFWIYDLRFTIFDWGQVEDVLAGAEPGFGRDVRCLGGWQSAGADEGAGGAAGERIERSLEGGQEGGVEGEAHVPTAKGHTHTPHEEILDF